MSFADFWDGNHPAAHIARRLRRDGYPSFGVGLPFASARAMCDYLDVLASDPDVIAACVTASRDEALTSEVTDALAAFVQLARQEPDA